MPSKNNVSLSRTVVANNERFMWILYGLLVFVFSVAAILLVVNRYQSRFELAQERLNNLAIIHDENLLLQMSNIESIARATVDEVISNRNQPDVLQDYVTSVAQRLPQLRTVVIVGGDGIIIADSRPDTPAIGIDVSDRAYFTVHDEQQIDSLYVDDPVLSRVDSRWSLPITLGIWDENDVFLGVVIASLDPLYFSSSIGNFVEQGITGYIAKDNGIILTSLPYQAEQIGADIAQFGLASLDYNNEEHSTNLNTSNINFVEGDLVIHRHIDPYRLQIIFSQPRASIVGSIAYDAIVTLVTLVFLSFITFLILYQQMRQTKRVQQSEYELRTLTDNISDFVIRFDKSLRHLYVNPAVVQSTGITLEQYIGKTNRELGMPEEQLNIWEKEIRLVFDTETPHAFEFNYTTVEGKRWFQAKLTPEFDQNNNVQAVLSVVRDITELKRAQQELEEKTRTLSLSLQAAQAGIWVWHINANINVWDETQEAIHGLAPGTFGGNYDAWRALVHPDDIDFLEAAIARSLEANTPFEEQFRIIRPDGAVRHLLGQATIVRDPDTHEPHRMIGVNIDISSRIDAEIKRIEAERARIEIEEQRKLIDLKERFIATASHDFRTPLAIIQTSSDTLRLYGDRITREQQQAKLERILEQVVHMTHLLDDVLTISKSHAHKLDVNLTEIDLREFCFDVWSNVVTLDAGKHLKDFKYNTDVDQLVGDPNLLRQAFDNLLNNALKYTPDGELVRFEISDDGLNHLIFKVIDEGYGIPEEDQAHLFEPFHRARNVANIKGTGLGLAIVKDYVELHNGSINVESEEGQGTTFTVQLPVKQAAELNGHSHETT